MTKRYLQLLQREKATLNKLKILQPPIQAGELTELPVALQHKKYTWQLFKQPLLILYLRSWQPLKHSCKRHPMKYSTVPVIALLSRGWDSLLKHLELPSAVSRMFKAKCPEASGKFPLCIYLLHLHLRSLSLCELGMGRGLGAGILHFRLLCSVVQP